MEEKLKVYNEYITKTNAYMAALSILSFDDETCAPTKGAEDRSEVISILFGEYFSYTTDEKVMNTLKELYEEDQDEVRKHVLKHILKQYEKSKNIPKELIIKSSITKSKAVEAWKKARENNDYKLFEKELIDVIEVTKETLKYIPSKGNDYDTLLDEYEPEMNVERYDLFFNTLKERLVPFIKKLQTIPQIDDSVLFNKYSIEKQKQVMEVLKKLLNYDSSLIYLAESAHPFSSTITLNDGRITVKYLENSLTSAIYSFIHEYGHALYGVQVDKKFEKTPIVHSMSMGMHESQSRMMENNIGRSEIFVEKLFEKLVEIFPNELNGVNVKDFYKMVNTARCSLIRIEADELTYPLHILVRYELEKAIFNQNLDYSEIKPLWNKLYKEYLGLEVDSDINGILQDIHFSHASFGYFPTYALGSAFAVQFFEELEKHVDIKDVFENQKFEVISEWLKENIHQYSSTISSYDLIKKVSRKKFDPNIYVDYLINKFSKVYGIK